MTSPSHLGARRLTLTLVALWLPAGMAAAILFAALGWGLFQGSRAQLSLIDRPVPDLVIRSLDGDEIGLRDLRGTPLVVNFWASWCVPCRQEAPVLAAAAKKTTGRVQFVGVDIQDTDVAARAYEAEIHSPYPVGPAIRGSYHDFGVTAPPETFFVNRDGVVMGRITGPVDEQRMRFYLTELGAGSSPAPSIDAG